MMVHVRRCLQRRLTREEIGLELGDGAAFPFCGLRQQRVALMRPKRRGLPIQGGDGAIAPHVFQNRFPIHHDGSPLSVPLRTCRRCTSAIFQIVIGAGR